jgi:hypothetical protein
MNAAQQLTSHLISKELINPTPGLKDISDSDVLEHLVEVENIGDIIDNYVMRGMSKLEAYSLVFDELSACHN